MSLTSLALTRINVAAAAIALVIAWALHARSVHNADAAGYKRAVTEMQASIAAANLATQKREQQERAESDKAATEWETERNALQSQVDSLLARKPSVRLCKPTARVATVPAAAEPTGQPDGAAVGSEPAVSVGEDIGAASVVLAGECERYRRQLSELQDWFRASHSGATGL